MRWNEKKIPKIRAVMLTGLEIDQESRLRLDFSVPGFSLFTQTPHKYFFFWQRSNAADQGRDDQAARVNPEREGEDIVPNGWTATAEDQESTEGSC